MADLRSFLGNKNDSKENPYESYDIAVANARRAAQERLGERALAYDLESPAQEENPNRPKKTSDNPVFSAIAKGNPELAQELEMARYGQDAGLDFDRNAVNAQLVKQILKEVNPTLINNIKYSPKESLGMFDDQYLRENEETQLRIFESMKPLLEKATEGEQRTSLEKFLKSQGKFAETKPPKIIPSYQEIPIAGENTPITLGRIPANAIRLNATGDILLNEDAVGKESYSIVPHETLHGLLPEAGPEDIQGFSNIPQDKLREALAKSQQGHIDTSSVIPKASPSDIVPSGESAIYWKIMKDLVGKKK